MEDEKRQIGQKIRAVREEKKMTQSQFSEKLDVSMQTISNWESGKSSPDAAALIRMAKKCHISLDRFAGLEMPPIDMQLKVREQEIDQLRQNVRQLTEEFFNKINQILS